MTDEHAIEHFRLFVAIKVPDAVREEVLRVQRELQSLAPRGAIRWTKPEQFHLTLRFLGDVASNQVAGLEKTLHLACIGVAPLHLQAQGVGFFPNAHRPRVIWVGINDNEDRLSNFQKKIENAVQPFAADHGGERFGGHVTLGRVKEHNRLMINELVNYSEFVKSRLFGEWIAREIEVIRSELLPEGPRYTSMIASHLGKMVEPE